MLFYVYIKIKCESIYIFFCVRIELLLKYVFEDFPKAVNASIDDELAGKGDAVVQKVKSTIQQLRSRI